MQGGVTFNGDLFAFQERGARWLAFEGGKYLADEQRVGKTPQLIRAADLVCADHVVVTCPASAIGVWERAIPRWSAGLWTYVIGSYDRHTDHGLPVGDVYIFDEAHRLKSFEAQRTQALLGKASPARRARFVWAASGTPAPNHSAELLPWLSFWGVWTQGRDAFLKRFCQFKRGPHNTIKVLGNKRSALPELRALWEPLHLRRLRKEVMPYELEPVEDDIILHAYGVEPGAQLYSIQIGEDDLPDEDDEHFATVCRLVGEAKAGPLGRFLADELDDGEGKVAVYYWHESVGDELAAILGRFGVARVDGKVPAGAKRTAQADRFNDDPACRVFLGQIMAAGEAIDLAKSCHSFVFAERSWTPGQNSQAAARLSGHLQTQRVLIRTAVLRGTLDEGQGHVLRRKSASLAQLHGEP